MYSYIIRMTLVCTRMSSVCIRMSSVCHSYVLMSSVCDSYVLVCHLYVLVCDSYVLICHPYVTRMWFYHEPNFCVIPFKAYTKITKTSMFYCEITHFFQLSFFLTRKPCHNPYIIELLRLEFLM